MGEGCSKVKNSKWSDPEALICLACLKNCKEASVLEGSERGEWMERKSRIVACCIMEWHKSLGGRTC